MELWRLTIHEAHQLLRRREISAVELTKAVLERLSEVEDKIKAFLTITDELALKMAGEADRLLAAGENITPLTGFLGQKGAIRLCSLPSESSEHLSIPLTSLGFALSTGNCEQSPLR